MTKIKIKPKKTRKKANRIRKNVVITLSKEEHEALKTKAKKENTTVSGLVGELAKEALRPVFFNFTK